MLSLPLLLIGFIGSFQTRINDCAQTRINNRAEDIIEGGFLLWILGQIDLPCAPLASHVPLFSARAGFLAWGGGTVIVPNVWTQLRRSLKMSESLAWPREVSWPCFSHCFVWIASRFKSGSGNGGQHFDSVHWLLFALVSSECFN